MPKILHFTDMHMRHSISGHSGFSERLSRKIPSLLNKLGEVIKIEKPDLIAASGDLLDVPHDPLHRTSPAQLYAQTFDEALEDYTFLRVWLENLEVPFLVVPGNHDLAEPFDRVFGGCANTHQVSNWEAHAFPDWDGEDSIAERQGDVLRRFEDVIQSKDNSGWAIHVQHYLIRPKVDFWHPMMYRNADYLFEKVQNSLQPKLFLSGHFHVGTGVERFGANHFSVCPAIAEYPHPYRLYDLLEDGTCTVEEHHLADGADKIHLLCIDRSDILTGESLDEKGEFVPVSQFNEIMEKATQAGFVPIMLSTWNHPQAVEFGWTEFRKRHDRLFATLGSNVSPGGGQVLYIDPELPDSPSLPDAPIATFTPDLPQKIATWFGSEIGSIAFITSAPHRKKIFSASGVRSICVNSSLEALEAIDLLSNSLKQKPGRNYGDRQLLRGAT